MKIRKDLVVITLTTFCLIAALFMIKPARAELVWDFPIPYVAKSSEVFVEGELNDLAWNYAAHFHDQSENVKTVEFDAYLMHDYEFLYIGTKIYNNDFWSNGYLGDWFEVEINDRNDGNFGGGTGNDEKNILVTPLGLGSYEDNYIPLDLIHDNHKDGVGAFSFSSSRLEGELGDYSFEMKIPINGSHPEDATLEIGATFGMIVTLYDYYPSENVGLGLPILQASFLLETRRPGDVNHDGTVDTFDAMTAALAFGSYPGHAEWNSTADLNEDGAVDIYDLILICNNFGRTY